MPVRRVEWLEDLVHSEISKAPGPRRRYGAYVTSTLASVPLPVLAQPLYGASPGRSVRRFWLKYATFTGRASRAEYWWVWLVNGLISTVILATTLLIQSVVTGQSWLHLFKTASPLGVAGRDRRADRCRVDATTS